ncbi:MBL fold metallo-hydrolase [Limibacter armeniacum]|uniref:MBL fold metallo-hydrolase n=1 Tax=Limibacter armeniacum TaxID=466084 RepID=UPI002FE62485
MKRHLFLAPLLLLICATLFFMELPFYSKAQDKAPKARIEWIKSLSGSLSSYIIYDGQSAILLDCFRNEKDAKRIVRRLNDRQRKPKEILITHGHPGQLLGLPTILQSFPEANTVTATSSIKKDIKEMMEALKRPAADVILPDMVSEKDSIPDFSFLAAIKVLNDTLLSLPNGTQLLLKSDYASAEAPHVTTVYIHDLNALFVSDLCYNKVHLWLGYGVDKQCIINWIQELQTLKKKYNSSQPKVFSGHGPPADMKLIDENIVYLQEFLRVIASSKTAKEAEQEMRKLYPNYEQADYNLVNSIANHFGK